MNKAFRHMLICQELLERESPSAARAYCLRQGIEPPHAGSHDPSAAADKLGDYGWWVKRLKRRRARESPR
ncbi:hypothetical protein RugamoR57_07810 [Duganella caerulea]|uniref:hypothetical protein n=1 Tax=Duganella caerulea TaxID=2885762 RepID=UPI0030E7A203